MALTRSNVCWLNCAELMSAEARFFSIVGSSGSKSPAMVDASARRPRIDPAVHARPQRCQHAPRAPSRQKVHVRRLRTVQPAGYRRWRAAMIMMQALGRTPRMHTHAHCSRTIGGWSRAPKDVAAPVPRARGSNLP